MFNQFTATPPAAILTRIDSLRTWHASLDFIHRVLVDACILKSGCSGGRLIGGSAPAMSFHDFMHVMHRYGAMPCTEACDPAEESDGNARVRQVFDKAREAHWSGSSNVRFCRVKDVSSGSGGKEFNYVICLSSSEIAVCCRSSPVP